MSHASSLSIHQVATGDLGLELLATRRVLERVPEEHFAWKPHAKSMSLGALAAHLVNLLYWQSTIVGRDELDLSTLPESTRFIPETREALLEEFDKRATLLTDALAGISEIDLGRPWKLKFGDRLMLSRTRADVLRGLGISHMIHHRGQLTVYLRMLDIPIPPLYGPTADERGTWPHDG